MLTYLACSDFSRVLKEMRWPFTSSSSSKAMEDWDRQRKRFTEVFNLLLQMDKNPSPSLVPSVPGLGDPVLLPIQLLLEPLRKRFKFHFFGERKTNLKEKVHL